MDSDYTIIHNRIQCSKCLDIIESEHRHDWKECKCGSVWVDGGKSYFRRGGQIGYIIDCSEVEYT